MEHENYDLLETFILSFTKSDEAKASVVEIFKHLKLNPVEISQTSAVLFSSQVELEKNKDTRSAAIAGFMTGVVLASCMDKPEVKSIFVKYAEVLNRGKENVIDFKKMKAKKV